MPETTPEAFSPFAVALGLAYQGLRLAQNTINFLPEDIKNVRGLQERRNEVVGMAAMLLVAIVLNFNVGSAYTTRYRSDTNELRRDMTEKQRLHQDVQKAQKQHGSLADAYEKLSKAVGWREYWFEFLKYFIERRPPEILVDEMHLRLDGNVVVRGRSPNQDSVTRMLTALEEFTWITWKIELGSMQEQYDPRFQSDMWDFEFTLKTLVRSGRVRTIGEQPVSTELLELQDELKRRGREARQQKKRSGRGRERP
jgi:Tfp pilus assembly protein PilN